MRVVLVLFVCVVAAAVSLGARQAAVQSLYSLKVPALSGESVDSKNYEGKVTLVVNVASQCGFTPQDKGLQQLHTELSPRGFSVLGFPSNDFGAQEPGTATEIESLLRKELRCDVSDVLEGRHQSGSRPVLGVPRSSARPATCRSGTSASTSSGRTAKSSPSSRARSRRTRPSCGRRSKRHWGRPRSTAVWPCCRRSQMNDTGLV